MLHQVLQDQRATPPPDQGLSPAPKRDSQGFEIRCLIPRLRTTTSPEEPQPTLRLGRHDASEAVLTIPSARGATPARRMMMHRSCKRDA